MKSAKNEVLYNFPISLHPFVIADVSDMVEKNVMRNDRSFVQLRVNFAVIREVIRNVDSGR